MSFFQVHHFQVLGENPQHNPPANAGDARDMFSIPGLRRSPGGENGNLLQYSCLESPMNTGAWWATVHWFAKSWTRPATEHTQQSAFNMNGIYQLLDEYQSYPLCALESAVN